MNLAHPKERCIGIIWETFKVKFFLGLGFRGSSCSLTSFFSILRGGVGLDFAKVICLSNVEFWEVEGLLFQSIHPIFCKKVIHFYGGLQGPTIQAIILLCINIFLV